MNSTVDNSETQAEVETGKEHPKKTKRSSGSGGGCNNFYYPLNTGLNIIPVGIGKSRECKIYDPQGGSGGGGWQGIPGEYEEPRTTTTLKALVMS
ncbi:hypothetical protein DID88_010220 [Monilinia fructigena]|uniref:Uncharacterized protein n=1 Tax=Monilinia fructigena TaxID=38457 RepID=A0A395IKU3_9HELO|nr:hypothetical protein DID88_010220 [Monilinia fructigena]